ncbi:kelch repeat protein [Necator americanus]|uniref:Kelch repeat protein n=1 Tax=Necator americanus TaxID=51031 RepID=W2TI51_NECAM|nr:kelch repeat protein [Necator americanus]ETN81503.1 kelch repeat protein [Necator americanus]
MSSGDYERMTESEILKALADERLDVGSREEEALITNWIAKNPKNNERMVRLKAEALRRRGTDSRLGPVVRDRIPREIILAIGGWSTGGPSDIVEVFNPRAHSWVVPESTIRYNGFRRLNSGEILNLERNHWYHLPFMAKQRSDAGAVVLAGRPTVIGGFDGRLIHNDIEMLDFESQSWLTGSSVMRSVRTGVSAVTYDSNAVIVVGGFNGVRRLKSTEFYDHRVGLWYPLPDMEITRSNFGIELMNGSIYIAGGFDGSRTTNTVERFDMRAYKWETLPSMSIPKSALRLIRIADHDAIKGLINFQPQTVDFI